MATKRSGNYHIEIDHDTCLQCAGCVAVCPTQALDMHALELRCDDPLCIGCDLCVRFCPVVSLALEERPAPVRVSALAHSPSSSGSSGFPG
jgi:NAD-dependent dihydropyrimidine dehydrogenase PreA subunit